MKHLPQWLAIALAGGLLAGQAMAADCTDLSVWTAGTAYTGGSEVQYNDKAYQANWWTRNQNPADYSGSHQEWTLLGACSDSGNGEEPGNEPPEITLTDPLPGDYPAGTQLTLAATASDPDGTVESVTFRANGQTIEALTQSPWSTVWTLPVGTHTLQATAVDNDGASSSDSLTVTGTDDNEAPVISLISPTESDDVAPGDAVVLEADASDPDGEVAEVAFLINGQIHDTLTSEPWTTQWTAAEGTFSFQARATDNDGATGHSETVTLQIGDPSAGADPCRPQGLHRTPGIDVPYCTVYDIDGREDLGANHQRRIIGYFTSWRNGANDQPTYLASDIPWEKLTHINYAFAHVNSDWEISVGDVNDPSNPATGMTWPDVPGAEMDPSLPYKGHFNLLNRYQEEHPHVRTLVAVGGWAETGGHFGPDGERVDDGGFYTMTTNPDGSVNNDGIETFAESAVEFIRTYGFDGVDIDYEYPTSMEGAGSPDDYAYSDNLRPHLWRSYQVLMRTLREKLDVASAEDGQHYLLTVAAPSSGYLLRGMETHDIVRYLDFVNIMTYDLHGAWNEYVGHNASLFDTGQDLELDDAGVYDIEQFGGIGYLNTDWAVHYFRGALQAGRINIGVPYYTRGWQGVEGGQSGLWGRAAQPDQTQCPDGTGSAAPCGWGATGINNMWHDKDAEGNELGAGSNPMWHALNLKEGILGSYLTDYDLDPENNPDHQLSGQYQRHYDDMAEVPWLWNEQQQVFLSLEDEQSMARKVQYVIDQGVGGIMFWELAGDYDWHPQRNDGQGEYYMGSTLTGIAYDAFRTAAPYGNVIADNLSAPEQVVDIRITVEDFAVGDNNYPLTPSMVLTNQGDTEIPGGAEVRFNMPTSTSSDISDQSGASLEVIEDASNPAGNNIGGLQSTFHRVAFEVPEWQSLAPGESLEITLNYYLPVSGPSGYRVHLNGNVYGLVQEYPHLPLADLDDTGPGNGDPGNGDPGNGNGDCDASGVPAYPDWPQTDWSGEPSHASGGDRMTHQDQLWQANWWTNGEPGVSGDWSMICDLD